MSSPPTVPVAVVRRGLRVLATAIRAEPRVFAVAVAGSAVYGAMTIASAYVLGAVTQHVILPAFRDGRTTGGALAGAGAAIFGVGLVKAAGIVVRRVGAGTLEYRMEARYRRLVTRQYLRLPLSWHQSHPTGVLLSNANADVEASFHPVSPMPFAIGVLLMLVITAGVLLSTDWVLALVGFGVFPALGVINVVYNRRQTPVATRAQQLRGEVSGIAHESFDGALVVKTLGREAQETARFRARSEELRDNLIAVGRLRALFDPLMEALPSLGVLVVLLVGTDRVAAGAIDTGELVRVAYLFTLLAFPVRAIGWVLSDLPRSVVGFDRVSRVLAATGALPYGEQRPARTGRPSRLDVRDVGFTYGDSAVLHDIGFEVTPGRTVALVGPTGAGKSTIASLLVRLVDPAAGVVRLDGADLRELAPGALAEVAAVVPQQTFLFDDSVRGNVTLGADFSDQDVWAALRLAQAEGFVAALADGLDTRVGERGTTLSGGQRQRLALARALVRRPQLLVLDDATSSVDPTVEAAILRGLREAELPATVVVVAYRQATIALADEVVFVTGGRVRSRGTHAHLLGAEPGYRHLVTAYAEAERERAQTRAAGRESL
ncbi:MAG: ABC transporter ATP-binding protein/permease [Actinomycetota bacterium]|nr:ABC transporter ATP-binding protein/permease [Actinomycetota bacterium]